MHTAWQDLRYAVRMLLKNSGLNLAAIATLALGMGATTCVFSVLKTVLIKPLPYHEPERLVWLANSNPSLGVSQTFLNSQDIIDYREEVKSFAQIASWDTFAVNLSGGRKAERVEHIYITPNFFQTLGIRPLLGRDFTPGDVENDDVVIISYGTMAAPVRRRPGCDWAEGSDDRLD